MKYIVKTTCWELFLLICCFLFRLGHFNSIHLQISITAFTSFMLDAPSIAATRWHAPRAAWGMRNNKACCHCSGGDLVARNQDRAQPIWDTYNVTVSYISDYTLFAYR